MGACRGREAFRGLVAAASTNGVPGPGIERPCRTTDRMSQGGVGPIDEALTRCSSTRGGALKGEDLAEPILIDAGTNGGRSDRAMPQVGLARRRQPPRE